LAEARKRQRNAEGCALTGIDPIEARSEHRGWKRLEAAKAITFDACAAAYIRRPTRPAGGTRTQGAVAQHADSYAGPIFGSLPVQSIDVGIVMKALEPIWHTEAETASRLRGRMKLFSIGRRCGLPER